MFLLSRHSKSTCMVHVGGAAWLYYICRIVHLELVFSQRKLLIIPFYSYNFVFFIIHISYMIVYPFLCPLMFCLFHFPDGGGSMFVHELDMLGPAGDNPHVIGTGMEKRSETLCHQFLLKSHLDIFVIHPHYFFIFILYIFYKLRACIYKFLLLVCICHRPFHHYQYYSL